MIIIYTITPRVAQERYLFASFSVFLLLASCKYNIKPPIGNKSERIDNNVVLDVFKSLSFKASSADFMPFLISFVALSKFFFMSFETSSKLFFSLFFFPFEY